MLPCFSIYSRCRFPFQLVVPGPQVVDVVHMVVERGEFDLLVSLDCFSYARQHRLHPFSPALCPVRWVLLLIPLDWRPSLHPLRPLQVVRGLLGYYAAIRLPTSVYHWLTSLDFPMQPAPFSGRAWALPVPA